MWLSGINSSECFFLSNPRSSWQSETLRAAHPQPSPGHVIYSGSCHSAPVDTLCAEWCTCWCLSPGLLYKCLWEQCSFFHCSPKICNSICDVVIIYTQKKYPKIIYTQSILCFLHMRTCLYDLYDYQWVLPSLSPFQFHPGLTLP